MKLESKHILEKQSDKDDAIAEVERETNAELEEEMTPDDRGRMVIR